MAKVPCFTANVSLDLANKLKKDLIDQGFEIQNPPYTIFSAKKKGISCTLYESGKLTVQGKEMEPFIEFYLEPEILKEFRFSHPGAQTDKTPHIGMDEAGKGDFFGPLCIAALYADESGINTLIEWNVRDSKRFSDANILKLSQKIKNHFSYTVIRFYPEKYNELYQKFKNLNRMMAWTHIAALKDLSEKTGCKKALLDQFADKSLAQKMLEQKKLDIHLEQKVRGEEDIVVAGASILARAAFLEGMKKLSDEYEIELPKGASNGVKVKARELIEKHGIETLPKVAKMHFKTAKEI